MKIKKIEKLAATLHDKNEYVTHTRNLKQALNYGLVLNKVHRLIKFNQSAWLKPYINMNADLKKQHKMILKKTFSNELSNSVFNKTMENFQKYRDIKLVTTTKRKGYLVSEQNYHTAKFFTKNLSAIETKKAQILINKPVY